MEQSTNKPNNNRRVIAVVAGCAVLLILCCCLTGIIGWVYGEQIQKMIMTQFLGESTDLGQAPVIPTSVPGGRITPPLSGVIPTQVVPTTAPSSSGNPLGDALGKVKGASKYRMEFAWTFGGMQSGKYQEQPFFNMSGEVDGQNSHFTSKGGLLAMLATDQNATIEFIEAGGKSYMKGVNMFGQTDPKQWYITDESMVSGFKDMGKPDQFDSFTGGKNADFKKNRSESLDGQSCDVYVYDMKSLQNAAILGMLGSAKDKGDFSAIDKAEMSVWLCGDGYVHKYMLDYQGHDSKDATQKAALKINSHMWDFGNPTISVAAPSNAKPMPK